MQAAPFSCANRTRLPVGPVTLGYGCHFGLGLFMPADGVELG